MTLQDLHLRWYRMGVERLDKETDIVRLVKKLRTLTQVVKEKFPWKQNKFKMEAQGKNILDIDSDREISQVEMSHTTNQSMISQ